MAKARRCELYKSERMGSECEITTLESGVIDDERVLEKIVKKMNSSERMGITSDLL